MCSTEYQIKTFIFLASKVIGPGIIMLERCTRFVVLEELYHVIVQIIETKACIDICFLHIDKASFQVPN